MRWEGHVTLKGETRNVYKIWVENREGKAPLETYGQRLVDSIKIDLKEFGFEGVDYIYLARDRVQWWDLVNTVTNLSVP
jgi:23S rRNA G2445 N2-methylase RlmL